MSSNNGVRAGMSRRNLMSQAASLTLTSAGISALAGGIPEVFAAAADGLSIPAEDAQQDLVLTAAYAASPPAVDGTAFTMESENIMALAYGGDMMQYRPVWDDKFGLFVADMAAPGDSGVVGRWAEKWERSSDGLTWNFTLKKGTLSPLGNEMTSADIKWMWQRAFVMHGLRFFFATVMFLASPDDVEVVDRYSVRFHLKKPATDVLKLMAMSYYEGPFDSVEAKKHTTTSDPWAQNWLKNNTAGFGPYRLVRNIPGQELALERNPHYRPRPPVKTVIIRIVPDQATRTALLQRGSIDYAMRLPERSLQALEKDPKIEIIRYTANFIPYVGPVQTNEIMAKSKVRQAMAYAVPYEEIFRKVYFGQGEILKSITPSIFPNYTPQFWPYKLDLEKAKSVLSEAGYPKGFDLRLSYDNSISEMEEAAVLVKASFERAGIRTTLDPLPAAIYSERKTKRELMCQIDNFQWPWIADTAYVCWVYLANPATSILDTVKFDNPEFNHLVTDMMVTPYGPERTKMDLRAQQIFGEEVPWILLVNPGWREAFRKGWTDFHWYPDNNVHFQWLYKQA